MNQVIGRATGGQQRHHRIDDHAFVDQLADRCEALTALRDRQRRAHRFARQRLAQVRVRMHEGRARHMQAHRFQQHLVAVGGAIERAGAGAVIGRTLGFEQRVASDFAGGELLAHLGLVVVRQAGAHRPRGHEHHRQVAEVQRTDQQARHDLVADAEQQCGVEDIVRQCDRRAHGDVVARKQRELHARQALRHAVAHGRHAARHLHRGAVATRLVANDFRKSLVGLVRRQHVVVRRDHADVWRALGDDLELVVGRHRGKGMRHVGAAHAVAAPRAAGELVDAHQVGAPRRCAALADALGDVENGSLHRTSVM